MCNQVYKRVGLSSSLKSRREAVSRDYHHMRLRVSLSLSCDSSNFFPSSHIRIFSFANGEKRNHFFYPEIINLSYIEAEKSSQLSAIAMENSNSRSSSAINPSDLDYLSRTHYIPIYVSTRYPFCLSFSRAVSPLAARLRANIIARSIQTQAH